MQTKGDDVINAAPRVERIKERINRAEYRVDADAVAVRQTERMGAKTLERDGEGRADHRSGPQTGRRFLVDGHRIDNPA